MKFALVLSIFAFMAGFKLVGQEQHQNLRNPASVLSPRALAILEDVVTLKRIGRAQREGAELATKYERGFSFRNIPHPNGGSIDVEVPGMHYGRFVLAGNPKDSMKIFAAFKMGKLSSKDELLKFSILVSDYNRVSEKSVQLLRKKMDKVLANFNLRPHTLEYVNETTSRGYEVSFRLSQLSETKLHQLFEEFSKAKSAFKKDIADDF